MGYSLNKLKRELTEKNVADEGLVSWGQVSSPISMMGAIGGALSATAKMVVVCKKDNNIVVIPFTNKEILYKEHVAYNKQSIASISLKGLLTKKLIITTQNGDKHKYTMYQGVSDLKTIISRLGL